MKKETSIILSALGIFLGTFCIASQVQGAAIILTSDSPTTTPQGEFEITLLLDPEEDTVNAFAGEISYDESLLAPVGVSESDSLGILWITSLTPTNGIMELTGVIPDGFRGVLTPGSAQYLPGTISTYRFRALKMGTATFEPKDFFVTLHDGKGTQIQATTNRLSLPVSPSGATSTADIDMYAPQPFTAQIVTEGSVFAPNPMLVFHTTDKESGINHYEIKIGSGKFEKATSPYPLDEEALRNTIAVRAIDNAGNHRDTVVASPYRSSRGLFEALLLCIVIFIVVVLISWVKRLKRYS